MQQSRSANATYEFDASRLSFAPAKALSWAAMGAAGAATAGTASTQDAGFNHPSAGVISVDTTTVGNGLGTLLGAGFNGPSLGAITGTDAATVAVAITKPTYNLSLTASTTLSIPTGVDGQHLTMCFKQNATTAFTVT